MRRRGSSGEPEMERQSRRLDCIDDDVLPAEAEPPAGTPPPAGQETDIPPLDISPLGHFPVFVRGSPNSIAGRRNAAPTQAQVRLVGQLSKVVPFLLLEQRCGMTCQAMLRQPRRCRCSRTG